MIIKIQKGFISSSHLFHKIDYNYSKLEKDNANLLINNLGSFEELDRNKINEICNLFDETVSLHDGDIKNKYKDILVSFQHDDIINEETINSIVADTINKLGYENCPHMAFTHFDTANTHVHILTSTVDRNGKWISDSKNYELCGNLRQLFEKKYKLKGLTRSSIKNESRVESLSLRNARKYYFQNAFKNSIVDKKQTKSIQSILSEEQIKYLTDTYLSTERIKSYLGDETFYMLYKQMEKNKMFNPFYIDELSVKLSNALKNSTDINDYFKQLDQMGVYHRILTNHKGNAYLSYGLKNESFYFSDSSLSFQYRFEGLRVHFKNQSPNQNIRILSSTNIDPQIEMVELLAKEVLKTAKTNKQYIDQLNTLGIDVITKYDKTNHEYIITGYKNNNYSNPYLLKDTILPNEIKWDTLQNTLQNENLNSNYYSENNSKVVQQFFHNPHFNFGPTSSGVNEDTTEEMKRKRKKKKKENDDNMNFNS